jgi:DNA-binding transcriptional LysR family regulator
MFMQIRMDWRSVAFDWNRARAFLVTAEEGSLSAAARALGMAQPTLSRQVAALEQELGVVLFERIGRRLLLTQSGLDLVEHVRAMGLAATRVSLTASGKAQSIEGSVIVTASEGHAAYLLPPIIARLRQRAPGITIEILAANAITDLRRREADIAIRNVRPSDPELFAKKIADETARLYAADSYLAECGPLDSPADTAGHRFVGFTDNEPYRTGLAAQGLTLTPRHFPVLASSHLVHWELVKRGLGIGVQSARIGDGEPGVRRVAAWLEPFVFPIWLVAHREVKTSRRVRLIFDLLAEELAKL